MTWEMAIGFVIGGAVCYLWGFYMGRKAQEGGE